MSSVTDYVCNASYLLRITHAIAYVHIAKGELSKYVLSLLH